MAADWKTLQKLKMMGAEDLSNRVATGEISTTGAIRRDEGSIVHGWATDHEDVAGTVERQRPT